MSERHIFYTPDEADAVVGAIKKGSIYDVMHWSPLGLIPTSFLRATVGLLTGAGWRAVSPQAFRNQVGPVAHAMCERMDELRPMKDGRHWTTARLMDAQFEQLWPPKVIRKLLRGIGEIPACVTGWRIASLQA